MKLLDSFMIMLRPMIGQYLKPLEENGTIEKIQRDVQLIAESDAIPGLAELIANLKEHNQLLKDIRDGHSAEPYAYPRTSNLGGHNGFGMSERIGPD